MALNGGNIGPRFMSFLIGVPIQRKMEVFLRILAVSELKLLLFSYARNKLFMNLNANRHEMTF